MPSENIPVWEKANLSLEEAAAYFGIGVNKLRDMTNDENCPFVLWNEQAVDQEKSVREIFGVCIFDLISRTSMADMI